MKKTSIIISTFLVLTIIFSGSLTVYSEENDNNCFSDTLENKLDYKLSEIIEDGSDEKIPVSIWFKDIDHETIKERVEKELASDIACGIMTQATIDLVFIDNLDTNNTIIQAEFFSKNENYDPTKKDLIEQTKKAIACKREISSNLYSNSNNKHLFDIKNCLSLSNDELSSCLLYSCKYAPNIEMCLTNEQIMKIVSFTDINSLLYIGVENEINTESKTTTETKRTDNSNSKFEETYDTSFYNVTGLNTARDAFGLSGHGMKVGMLESQGIINPNLVTTYTTKIHKVSSTPYPYTNHATTVAKLMVGYLDGYCGAIPNANLYHDSYNKSYIGNGVFVYNIKQRIESLIDNNVTAINCSFNVGEQGNVYGDYARWYDHVSIQHNVHLVLTASNYGINGVPDSNMSYNAIVVGNCNNNGIISSTSSYCNSYPLPYKPDLVAPGVDIHIIPNYTASGTSFSAPLVTASVIQLAQSNAVLLSNPRLMKSLLISSSKITNGMSSDPMYSYIGNDSIAYSRVYGSGMLYVPNAYTAFNTGNYEIGTLSENNSSDTYNANLKRAKGKKLRVCLTWDKVCTVSENHQTDSIISNHLSLLRLRVTEPNGNVYTSTYTKDNKQMITILPQTNGNYQFEVELLSSETDITNYAISWSLAI
ncbi:S8 family peptidase [Ruminococcus sp.]|uniref:S8 family peptidase n=1 Tax=Ruminococcus sp. TaxID=41978 RepID=UPI0038901F3C